MKRTLAILTVAMIGCLAAQTQSKSPKTPEGIPRTPDGKPNFTGIYEWPKSRAASKCTCSATIFDKKAIGAVEARRRTVL